MQTTRAYFNRTVAGAIPLLLAALLVGCGQSEIRSYRVDKAQPELAGPKPHVHYDTPAGWEETQPGAMRVASFNIHRDNAHADVSVTPLPGAQGIELDSVNMWRSEFGLPATTAEALKSEPVRIGESEGHLYEIESQGSDAKKVGRTLGAIMNYDGATWFFKMTGDKDLVASERENFKKFLASVDIHSGSHGSDPHSGMSSSGAPTTQNDAPESEFGDTTWDLPAGWQRKAPGPMVYAAFAISKPNGQADVSISVFPGETGGMLANANRWRAQVGLGPITQAELKTEEIGEGANKLVVVDYTGERNGQPARLVAAVATNAGNSWFYKLLGSSAVVEAERQNFIKFVQSAKYPNAG